MSAIVDQLRGARAAGDRPNAPRANLEGQCFGRLTVVCGAEVLSTLATRNAAAVRCSACLESTDSRDA